MYLNVWFVAQILYIYSSKYFHIENVIFLKKRFQLSWIG